MDINLTDGNDVFEQQEDLRFEWHNYRGLGGDDVIRVYQGYVVGGPGNDRIERIPSAGLYPNLQLSFEGTTTGVVVNLEEGWAQDGNGGLDTLVGITSVHGTGYADWIKGDAADNYFWANGGDDTLIGGGGTDGLWLPGFQPIPNREWISPRPKDLSVVVSGDGQSAVVQPLTGTGFRLNLQGIEFIELWAGNGAPSERVFLADLVTQKAMAKDVVAAGEGFRWNTGQPMGTGLQLTFSFITAAPASGVGAVGFRTFSEPERVAVRNILTRTAALTGLSFVEVSESSNQQGQLRFGVSQQSSTKGVSWTPGQPGAGALSGDVWMDVESMIGLAPGSEGYAALLHEIGHALGLRHTINVDAGDQWSSVLLPRHDRTALSVMSQQRSSDGLFRSDWGPLDVLALRHLYGARQINTGNNVYRLGSKEAASQTNITDDGGVDTIDASPYLMGVQIDLSPRGLGLANVGMTAAGLAGIENLSITEGSVIENIVGTAFDDVLKGNSADNRITAGAGNDWIEGGDGVDTAVFAGNYAAYHVSNAYGRVFVQALDGTSGFDTLIGVEVLSFSDRTIPVDSLSIAGDLYQGEILEAVVTTGDPARMGTLRYQWRMNEQDVAGANGPRFTLTQVNVAQTISVLVTYTDSMGVEGSFIARSEHNVHNVNDAPTGSVTISGLASVGQTLRVNFDLSDPDGYGGPGSVWYVWRRDGVDIQNSNQATYTVTRNDIGRTISVAVQYWDWGGNPDGMVSSVNPVAGLSRTGTFNAEVLTGDIGENLLRGLAGNDSLTGLEGNDSLDGGAGADSMSGGAGSDTYTVDDAADQVVETDPAASGGRDIVRATISYTLPTNVEVLVLTGTAALNGNGNSLANSLHGNIASNILNGGAGADTMAGGDGSDVYVVDNAGDVVYETNATVATGGVDLIKSTVAYTLPANVENLQLIGSNAASGNGNALPNQLSGNSAANTLDGRAGADSMAGGDGDDTYIVDNSLDIVTETHADASVGGIDHVKSGVTFTLSSHVEWLTLTGSSAINGTGNELGNRITGNSLSNVLDGRAGADTLSGGAGNDTYLVDNLADVVIESVGGSTGGIDLVRSQVSLVLGANVERLTLEGSAAISGTGNELANLITGNAGANAVSGGAGNDTLSGGDGADTLTGGAGADSLTGGSGADSFRFVLANEGTDTITDFQAGVDVLLVSAANFGLTPATPVNLIVNGNPQTAAAAFLYDSSTGTLRFDPDGTGAAAAVTLAVLKNKAALTAASFAVGP